MENTIKGKYILTCNKIKNEQLFNIVFNTLKVVPDYFYTIPSSSSGKYHPEDELGEGGLIKHVLKTVKVADILAPAYQLSENELELCKTALLLHDCCKSGKKENSGHTEFLHPNYAAELILESNKHNKYAKKVTKLVKSHMGIWNTSKYCRGKLNKPKTKLEKFVHMCDFIASRKELIIEL